MGKSAMDKIVQSETTIKLYEFDYEKPDLSDETLEHHGILGMHWGRRNGTPYPLDSSKSTGSRLKSRSGKISRKRKKSLKKARRVKAKNAKRRIKEQKRMKDLQKSKEDIINSKDIKSMAKNIDKFSNQEINDMLTRLDTERRLREKVREIEKANMSTGQRIKEGAKSAIVEGAKAGASSVLKTVSKNAIKMGSKKLVKEMIGEENKELQAKIDQLFKEEKKK
jgi:hypothetical protein